MYNSSVVTRNIARKLFWTKLKILKPSVTIIIICFKRSNASFLRQRVLELEQLNEWNVQRIVHESFDGKFVYNCLFIKQTRTQFLVRLIK